MSCLFFGLDKTYLKAYNMGIFNNLNNLNPQTKGGGSDGKNFEKNN